LPKLESEGSEILNTKNNLKIKELRKYLIKKIIETKLPEKIIIEHFPF
jgi:intergrase/recombinase